MAAMRSVRYGVAAECSPAAPVIRETSSAESSKPKLLDRVRHAVRARHYSRRTEKAYVHWIKRYIFFHGKRHPGEMGAVEVTAFLTALAVRERVAASTRPPPGRRVGRAAVGARSEVPQRGARMGLAMGVPGDAILRRPSHGSTPPPSSARVGHPA